MKGKKLAQEVSAVGMILTSGGLFVLRACRSDDALSRAGRHALTAATVVAPLAGTAGYVLAKDDGRGDELVVTAELGGAAAIAAAALAAIASLAADAFRA
jgi:hypothetical protein